MKLSTLTLATTVALTFSGCVIDDALNSVAGTIDSITAPNKTTNTSNKYNLETKNLSTVTQLENFCKNSPDGISYIITALPDLKTKSFPDSVAEELMVINSKIDITVEAMNPREYMNYRSKAFDPSEYDPYNPKQKIKLIKPIMVYKSLGTTGISCKLKYSEPIK